MERDEHPVDIHPDKQTAERQELSTTPGRQEDIETASARETRVEREDDVASDGPGEARPGERRP